jgi:hypothetical protein
MPAITGSITDPDFRHRRAKLAAEARASTDHDIKALVDRAPELTPEQRDRLATLLRSGGDAV